MTTLRALVLGVGLCLVAIPAAAQDAAPPPAVPAVEVPEVEEEGLTGSVTDESAWQDLGVAIPAFATDREQPTPANSQGTGALGVELSRVIFNDLRNNGLFRPVGPDSLPRPAYQQITAPAFATWQGRSERCRRGSLIALARARSGKEVGAEPASAGRPRRCRPRLGALRWPRGRARDGRTCRRLGTGFLACLRRFRGGGRLRCKLRRDRRLCLRCRIRRGGFEAHLARQADVHPLRDRQRRGVVAHLQHQRRHQGDVGRRGNAEADPLLA